MGAREVKIGFVILLVVLAVVWLLNAVRDNPINTAGVINNLEDETDSTTVGSDNAIEITANGYSPKELTINKGDTVTWINKDTEEHWPASAMHPTHTNYAGGHYDEVGSYMGSQACVTEGQAKEGAFDHCKPIAPGDSWSFTFDQVGTWSYHDHIVNGLFGKIIVN